MSIKDLKGLDALISEIEFTHNKVPILLKKYLSQNAKIIGFNIDPKFNDSLDGITTIAIGRIYLKPKTQDCAKDL